MAQFGTFSPLSLLSIREASKEAFDAYIGADRVGAIASQIEAFLTTEEHLQLKAPAKPAGRLGALIFPPPDLK